MNTLKWAYKVFRSLIFTVIIVIVVLFAFLYTALSIPPVQDMIRKRAQAELSSFFGNKVEISGLTINPLNEVIIKDATVFDSDGKHCLEVGRLGAGINLWRLIFSGEIEVTYVELLDFKADIYQKSQDAPLNIDFIIKAFAPNEKKEPSRFDLKIHNIVVRNGSFDFSRLWKERRPDDSFDVNHIAVSGFSADITIPRLSNDDTEIDLRRLSFNERSGLQVKDLSGIFSLLPEQVKIEGFSLRLPGTALRLSDFSLPLAMLSSSPEADSLIEISLDGSKITPSDFSCFLPALGAVDFPLPLEGNVGYRPGFISLSQFHIGSSDNLSLQIDGTVSDFNHPDRLALSLPSLALDFNGQALLPVVANVCPPKALPALQQILNGISRLSMHLDGAYRADGGAVDANLSLTSNLGNLNLEGKGVLAGMDRFKGNLALSIPDFDIEGIASSIPLKKIVEASIESQADINFKSLLASAGNVNFSVDELLLPGRLITSISGNLARINDNIALHLAVDDDNLSGSVDASALLQGVDTEWNLTADIRDFDTYNSFLTEPSSKGYELKGLIKASARGDNLDNLTGSLTLSDFCVTNQDNAKIAISDLLLSLTQEGATKSLQIESDILDLSLAGPFVPSRIPAFAMRCVSEVGAPFLNLYHGQDADAGAASFDIAIKDASQIIDFFNLPVFPLTALDITGSFDSHTDIIQFSTAIPYIQQGKNLITDTYLDLLLNGESNALQLNAGTVYPTKKGLLKLDMDLSGQHGHYSLDLGLNKGRDVAFGGDVFLDIAITESRFISESRNGGLPDITLNFSPAVLQLNGTDWHLEGAEIAYNHTGLYIRNFGIGNADQYILINGNNTSSGLGVINLTLSNVDVDYVFDTLNINYVMFGGVADGRVVVRELFGSNPQIYTEDFFIKNLSYNGGVLGNAVIHSNLDFSEKKVAIKADIEDKGQLVAKADGGVWFGRDSLSFKFDANRVNVAFMRPFMKAFSSELSGKASGQALLYGTFSDIDMVGTIVAEDVSILIDYINARYTASDTVYLHPGRIEIPGVRVTDKFGNTAVVNGILTHRYFHEPAFTFEISDMDHLLVYDTNPKINPLWYGTIFASGSGEVKGAPGYVNISANVITDSGSDFTFVLSDQMEAVESNFLTFSDRRKEEAERLKPKEEEPEFLQRFRKTVAQAEENPDLFTLDLKATVTDDVKLNLVMDPIAGDKITAYGDGAMTMTYASNTDELRLYGKYVLEKGNYNFSLQDIILKDFTIRPGSSIAFTGDPYTGILDITGAYRVNANLTELDKSFASDRELNRTNVPVEALLKVSGVLNQPTIDFDIEMPTVTEETARKVRSIISTDDMMSRQVLYLVALNKFYSPEYMSTNNTGGEWASVASSTISSQIQNVIGQITDKFTFAPSIRSDKGDFSDIEFDLALSSQLFNNRLLINGNIGYRDPSNSSTTFVGDFDLEYLLTKKGNWRLKAFNHFNDQNYYLKSALTTQGLGIVWRKEFGRPAAAPRKEDDTADDQK